MKTRFYSSQKCAGESGVLNPSVLLKLLCSVCICGAVFFTVDAQERRMQQPQYQPPPQPSPEPTLPSVVTSPNEDYRLGPSDVIEIRVEDAPELSRPVRISAAGTFLMPYLGIVNAKDKTVQELENFIADRLRGRYLKDPHVTVLVRQINSRSFFIQGAVRRPGVYQIEGRPSLLKLITVAGGLMENHGSTAFIIRELKSQKAVSAHEVEPKPGGANAISNSNQEAEPKAEYEMLQVNINSLLKGHFDQNIFIEPQDFVNIPPTDVFFVAGEVVGPGAFPLKEGTTLRQAISLAQGTTFKAALGNTIIFREDQNGKRQEIRVDLAAVMRGKKEDLPIMANDVIIVPNSRIKTTLAPILNAFGYGVALSTGQRIPVR
jgi:polysaccharide export outer membrane protein